MKNNKILYDFVLFMSQNSKKLEYDYLSKTCLREVSFIHYIAIPVINGEIIGKPKQIKIKDFYNDEYFIIAFNELDNFVLEVV